LPATAKVLLEPRKRPVQARSTASVAAILEATIQVLLRVGKERLTTTRVAERAGVSVGTLYQYFPNKSALLRAILRRHMDDVNGAVERVGQEQRGRPAEEMVAAVIEAFLAAKMRNAKMSMAMYSVSADVDGAKIVQQASARSNAAIVDLLTSARPALGRKPQLVADMLQGSMAGVSRRLLDSGEPEKHIGVLREELIFLARAYVRACAG
jgi:AcrR family transcriptional regulator